MYHLPTKVLNGHCMAPLHVNGLLKILGQDEMVVMRLPISQ